MAKQKKTSKKDKSSSSKVFTAEEVFKEYTVAELRKILKENGLSTSGKKKDLVERVLPVLNEDSTETPDEAEKAVSAQTEDSSSVGGAELALPDNEKLLSSVLGIFGINYTDLPIKDKIVMNDSTNLNIEGFTQKGLSMSDANMSVVTASDSSSVDLKMNIPEVSYTDFESTIFTFKDLVLSILPSSNPKSLEFSALLDSLDVITEKSYVNLKGFDLVFKSFPDENAISLDINIDNFIYPDFNDVTIIFKDISLNISGGLDGQDLAISVSLPSLDIINKNYKVGLSDLNINMAVPNLKVSDFDLSILISDFHYTNFEDVDIDMKNADISLETISNSNNFNVIIRMNSFDATGLNSFDELFPMINITSVNFKNPVTDSEFPINLTGLISPLDISRITMSDLASLLTSGFDLDTYISNMPNREVSLDIEADENFNLDLGKIFENFDFSSLDGIVLNLSGLIDSAGIDLADFGIDASNYDLSAISVPEIMTILEDSGFNMDSLSAMFNLFTIDFDKLDTSGLIVGFDVDNFDISGLLASLNLSDEDISAILQIFTNLDLDLESIFKNFDFSCLDGIVLDLSGLIDSLGIDLADFGIDVSGYDLSAITFSDIMAILNDSEFDMSAFAPMLELFNIDLNEIDMSGLVKSFDVDNFDMSSLLASLNLSGEDISTILEILTDPDFDFAGMFENCDYSCLDAIVLDLTGLIDSLGIDVNDLGVDLSGYDLSAITMSDIIAIFSDPDLDMSKLDFSDLDLNEVDMSGLVKSFDSDNFDLSGLLTSLDLSGEEISGIIEMFTNSGLDSENIFENCDYSCFDAIVLDLSGLIDSIGIDLADFGIDVSGYDLSAITLSDLIDILNNSDFSMDAILAMFKLSDLELDDLDFSGLVKSFDVDNFDISAILKGLDLPIEDISAIFGIFNNSDLDWETIFENCDYSCLNAIVLDLTGFIDSAGIDLADFGIDVSDYDLSAIGLADLIDIINDSDFNMDAIMGLCNLFTMDFDNLDLSELIVSFDLDNVDIDGLMKGLESTGVDVSGILDICEMYGFDLKEFLNQFLTSFTANPIPENTSDK